MDEHIKLVGYIDALNGRVCKLQCFLDNEIQSGESLWDPDITYAAAQNGNVHVMKFIFHNAIQNDLVTWNPFTTYYLAGNGHSDCLEFVVNNGCPWHPCTMYNAAINGHIKCLKIAINIGIRSGKLSWHSYATCHAAEHNRKDIVKYIFEKCKDLVSWEDSRLQERMYRFPQSMQNYIESIRAEWINNTITEKKIS